MEYRKLGNSGTIVTAYCLGTMTFGHEADEATSHRILDDYAAAGGNFIDTANNYQNEESETWIGEWMKERGNRDRMVIATKFTTPYRTYELGKGSHSVNFMGNHRRSLHVSVRDSLKKLQTDYVDLYYLHRFVFICRNLDLVEVLMKL